MIKCIIFDKDGTLINHDKLFTWQTELIDNLKKILKQIKYLWSFRIR